MAWDDDKRAKVKEMYLERNPTPENSMDIVTDIAEEMGESINGVRAILSKAEVYVKKNPAEASKTTKSTGKRVSKDAAFAALRAAIEEAGKDVDEEIISKLTGKAALYFVEVLGGSTGEDDE